MLKFTGAVTKRLDKLPDVQKALKELEKTDVLVGIPENKDARKNSNTRIGNAELLYIQTHGVRARSMREDMKPTLDKGVPYSKAYQLYIHEHGSPLWRIPPRPLLEPAIESVKKNIAVQLQKAVKAALSGKDPTVYLMNAGMLGQNAAKAWPKNPNNGWSPLDPKTIKMKKKKHSKGDASTPLIDTGQMVNAITFVIRKK